MCFFTVTTSKIVVSLLSLELELHFLNAKGKTVFNSVMDAIPIVTYLTLAYYKYYMHKFESMTTYCRWPVMTWIYNIQYTA